MAVFAEANSGYGDPLRAQTLQALEKRQAALLAQAAADKPDAAMMATIPGGIGHVLGVIGDNMQQARADNALAANRADLAKAMTGYDREMGMTPEQMGVLARVAPDIMEKLMTHEQERWKTTTTETGLSARNAATNDTTRATNTATVEASKANNQLTNTTSAANVAAQQAGETTRANEKIAAEKAAAVEAARVAQEAANTQEERLKARPQTDLAKLTQALGRPPTEEEVNAAIKHLTANSPSEDKVIIGERDKAIEAQSTLRELDEAHRIITSPEGIHSGNALITPLKTALGSVIPQSLGGPDDKVQANTKRFNQIMKSQGLQNLLAMKGASSDKDVALNLEIANDPSQPLKARQDALGIVRDKLYTRVQTNKEDIARIGAPYPTLQNAPGGAARQRRRHPRPLPQRRARTPPP